jgi:hypothetical protein
MHKTMYPLYVTPAPSNASNRPPRTLSYKVFMTVKRINFKYERDYLLFVIYLLFICYAY